MSKFFSVFLWFIFAGSAYAHWDPTCHYPPAPSVCPYNYSNICVTGTGRTCSQFAVDYQPSWFSSCQIYGSFFFCADIPTFPRPMVQSVCSPKGSICACSFGLWGGLYRYETGFVY